MPRVALRVVALVLMLVLLFLSLPLVCAHGHSHDHAHGHAHEEPPAFKWSKEANEAYQDTGDVGGAGNDAHNHHHAHAHSHSHSHSHEHSHSHAHIKSQATEDPTHAHSHSPAHPKPSVWMEALTATLAISIAPYLILFFIPVTNSKAHEPYLKALLAFASGGLLGDAFLHLIPHALIAQASSGAHTHSHAHSHSGEGHGHDMGIGLAVLGGIIAFLVVEKIVRIFKGGHAHSHAHSHAVKEANGDAAKGEGDKAKKGDKEGDKKKSDKKKNSKQQDKKSEGTIKVAGYLNLAADFTHNLTDGLAIGASFLAGKSVGMVTTFTIFLHEIPHEIGDFAILLQSGCSRRKAMMLQLVTAVGALTGTCISLLAEGADESAVAWVLPFTAGGFIYIATVSVIPELLENTSFWQSVVEIVALLSGVMLMMAIAHLEELSEHEH